MQRFGIILVLVWISLFAVLAPVSAQIPETLTLNESVSGTLAPESSVLYTFEIPVTQDVTVSYTSDKFLLSGHTVTTTIGEDTIVESRPAAGGGGDGPTTGFFIIPAYHLPTDQTDTPDNIERQVELRIGRPYDTPADFTLLVQTIDPLPLIADNPLTVTPSEADDTPFQLFVIESPYETPFVIQVQEFGKNQTPHMVDYIPPLLRPYDTVPYSDTPLIYADFFDVERWGIEPDDDREMTLYYAGDNSFRLKVETSNAYNINFQPLAYTDLRENQVNTIVVSDDTPLQMFRLNVGNRQSVTLNARVVSGTGADILVYAVDNVKGWEALRVGNGVSSNGAILSQDDTLTVPITLTGQLELSVMINHLFTGNRVIIELEWVAN